MIVSCLIVIGAFSEWPGRVGLQRASAGITVERLRTVFANKGISEILISDNSPQFVAGVYNNFVRRYNIRHLQSAQYNPATHAQAGSFVKMLCHPATNEQADSFVKLLKRAVRKGEFASAQAMFLLLYDNVLHPANAGRLYGRALMSRLDLLRPGRSVDGVVRDFDVGQWVMEPASCLVQIDGGGVWTRHVEQRHCRCSASPPPPPRAERAGAHESSRLGVFT